MSAPETRLFSTLQLLSVTALLAAACGVDRPPFEDGTPGTLPDRGPGRDQRADKKKPPPGDLRADKKKPPPPGDLRADKKKPPPKDLQADKTKPPPPDKGPPKPCPPEMVAIQKFCMDRYEAPNKAAQYPLVMFHYNEALAWCQARQKRLCYDDEWTLACGGTAGTKYPYGNTHKPGVCNDNKTWKTYSQTKLNGWPSGVSTPTINSLAALWAAAKVKGSAASTAVDHLKWLYQAELSGAKKGCNGPFGVHDLCGNIEEWTTRRDGGKQYFHGNLKGRYWSEPRTCQSGVKTHGDSFRFYEIGFRCCKDQTP